MTTASSDVIEKDAASVLAAAQDLAPEVRERALETERNRNVVPELIEAMHQSGVFQMMTPRAFGGLELDPIAQMEVYETICAADGSTGWLAAIGCGNRGLLAWFEPSIAREIMAEDPDERFLIAGAAAPTARGELGSDGMLDLTGRWQFNSGCLNSNWLFGGVIVQENGQPRMLPDRGPDWRFAFYRKSDGEVIDTWDVAGLKGTGSHDCAVKDLRLPMERTIAPPFEPPKIEGPWWNIPYFTGVSMQIVGIPLGIARGALDEFIRLAPTKMRKGPDGGSLAEDKVVQVELGKAEARLRSARAFALDSLGDIWSTALAGDEPSLDQRARQQLAGKETLRAATESVDRVFHLSGAGSLYSTHPLQRALRDIHAFNQHLFFSQETWNRYACVRFGIEQPTVHI